MCRRMVVGSVCWLGCRGMLVHFLWGVQIRGVMFFCGSARETLSTLSCHAQRANTMEIRQFQTLNIVNTCQTHFMESFFTNYPAAN